jgi:hypothetical protein
VIVLDESNGEVGGSSRYVQEDPPTNSEHKHKAPLYEKASKPNPVKTPSQITPSLGLGFEQKTPPPDN